MTEITPIPLAQLTTLRTGAAPEQMLDATTTPELIDALPGVLTTVRGDGGVVLVPAPDGPTIAIRSPTPTSRSMPWSTSRPST